MVLEDQIKARIYLEFDENPENKRLLNGGSSENWLDYIGLRRIYCEERFREEMNRLRNCGVD